MSFMYLVQSHTMFHAESLASIFYFNMTDSESTEKGPGPRNLVLSNLLFWSSFRKNTNQFKSTLVCMHGQWQFARERKCWRKLSVSS